MTSIESFTHTSMAIIRIYRNTVTFNGRATNLLVPRPAKRIRFLSDSGSLYVCGTESRDGISPTRRKGRKGVEINSRSLCERLLGETGGCGTLRVREDRYTFDNGETCYLVERLERQ